MERCEKCGKFYQDSCPCWEFGELPLDIGWKGMNSRWCFSLFNKEGEIQSCYSREAAEKAVSDGFTFLEDPAPGKESTTEKPRVRCRVCGQWTRFVNSQGVCFSCEDQP